MNLQRKLRTFFAMSGADRWLIFESIAILAGVRFIVFTFPFNFIVTWLCRAPETIDCDKILLLSVRKAITTAARNVPWQAACLPQAIAAKAMLTRRGCGSSFHFGADFDAQGKLIAHAWLVAGGTVVVGAAGIPGVTPLARFG